MSRRERKILRQKGLRYKPDQTIITEESKAQEEHKPLRRKQGPILGPILEFYEKRYKGLMFVTFFLFIVSLIIIGTNIAVNGELFPRGVSLKGGVTITVPMETAVDVDALQTYLRGEFPAASINVRAMSTGAVDVGFVIEASDVDSDQLLKAAKAHVGEFDTYSLETMGSALGSAFFKQTIFAMIIAFVLMSIVVFVSFKTLVPSAAVVMSALSDILMTIAVLIVFDIKVETAGIAALLMLIGYSVDTDILLTTRVLKREGGTVFDRCVGSMKTGLTMTITAIAAVLVAYIFTHSETLRQIMLILIIGLIFDMFNTWIQNVGLLRWYLESKSKKQAEAIIAAFDGNKEEDRRRQEEAEEAEFEDIEEDEAKEEKPKKPVVHHAPEHKPAAQHTAQSTHNAPRPAHEAQTEHRPEHVHEHRPENEKPAHSSENK